MDFNNGTIEIWTKSEAKGIYVITTKNPFLASKLNKILQHYPKGTRFHANKEPSFPIYRSQIKRIAAELPVLSKIFAQITNPALED